MTDNIIFIGDKEFEDCFKDKYIADVINNAGYLNKENNTWNSQDIRNLREKEKFSDEIKKLINKNIGGNSTNDNYLSKPLLGELLGRYIEIEHMPYQLFDILLKAREIAGIYDYSDDVKAYLEAAVSKMIDVEDK